MSALLAPRPWQPSAGKLPSCKQNSFQLLALLMSLLVSHENISSFTSDSVRRTQDMLSGSASFQMHPRNPFRNLLELFLWSPVTSIILLPTPSLLLDISSLSFRLSLPLPASPPSSPLLLLLPLLLPLPTSSISPPFHVMLASSSHHYCTPYLTGSMWQIYQAYGAGIISFSLSEKKQAQLWTKSMGVKKKKRLPHSALTDHETGTFCS